MGIDLGSLSGGMSLLQSEVDSGGGAATVSATAGDFDTVAATTVTTDMVVTGYVDRSIGVALESVGTDRATALALTKANNFIATAGSTGTGAVLPDLSGNPGADCVVFNAGANPIKIYAAGSQTIDGTAGATGVTLTNAKRAIFFMTSATAWVSAQLGVVSA